MARKRQAAAAKYDFLILSRIRSLIQAFDVHSRRLNSRHGLTGPQLVCLLDVMDNEGTTAREISGRIHVGQSTLVGVLDRLESKGFVERHRDFKDRRRILITATREGKRTAKKMPSPLDERLADALSSLPEAEQARIADSLLHLVEMIEAPDVRQQVPPQRQSTYRQKESA
jgi:DNA-binding MarR family transcriptional regulator